MPLWNPTGGAMADDGNYITLSYDGTDILRIRKSDNQIQIQAGLDSDITF